MAQKLQITEEEYSDIKAARKKNRYKSIEISLRILVLRFEGKSLKEIGALVERNFYTVSKVISRFKKMGLEYLLENHRLGNRRNLTYEQEEAVLEPFRERMCRGEMVSVREMAVAYQAAVSDHKVSDTQIYAVLKRHGFRSVMPRSRHPKKASEETIQLKKKKSGKLSRKRSKQPLNTAVRC